MERRLAAIVALDIVGYSALVEADETATLSAVRSIVSEVMQPFTDTRGGRIVKTTGDGALVVFDSALQAVCFAIEFQRHLRDRTGEPRLEYRVGINLGDVVFQDEDIFGDGVNIAARLEGQADPGGIMISRSVRDQVRDRMQIGLAEQGMLTLKNISRPIRTFHILLCETADELPASDTSSPQQQRRIRHVGVMGFVAATAILVAALWALDAFAPFGADRAGLEDRIADRPALAVQVFRDVSNGDGGAYFARGIARDIVTELSRFDELTVIAGSSSLDAGESDVPRRQIAQELGARYLLEGDVRRDGDRSRISVQLIDTTNGRVLWAETFEEVSADLFAVQDRIVQSAVGALVANVNEIELGRVSRRTPANLAAYELLLRGRDLARGFTRAGLLEARTLLHAALVQDPNYASAASELGFTYFHAVTYGWSPSPNAALNQAADLARRSLEIDPNNVDGHRLLGRIMQFRGDYEGGLAELETAIALNGNNAASQRDLGIVRLWSGETAAAVGALEIARRFDPNLNAEGLFHLGAGYFLLGQFEDAIRLLTRSVQRNPDFALTHVVLAAAFAESGQMDRARGALDDVRRRDPFFSLASFGSLFRNAADAEKLVTGLQKAGLTDR